MKTINYKGKGEHSVRELELIIEQQVEELHLYRSGQKQLPIHDVSRSLQLYDVDELNEIVKMYNNKEIEMFDFIATVWNKAYAVGRNDG